MLLQEWCCSFKTGSACSRLVLLLQDWCCSFKTGAASLRLVLLLTSEDWPISQFYHARRPIGLALGICPRLGTSLAKIYLLPVVYISLVPCAISSIQLRPCP